jgi:hypothetical protein
MAEILPPYIAPLYMLTSRMIALIGPNGSVRGKMIAIPSEDPIPGRAPAIMPSVSPMTTQSGVGQVKTIESASEKAAKAI